METLTRKQALLTSKEELVDLVLELQAENERLRKENEKLREQLHRPARDSHNSSPPPSTDHKARSVPPAEKEGKKKGPPFGHAGTSRKKREADMVLIQKVKVCLECKNKIDSDGTTYVRKEGSMNRQQPYHYRLYPLLVALAFAVRLSPVAAQTPSSSL